MGFLDNGLSSVVVVFDHMLLTYYCAKCLSKVDHNEHIFTRDFINIISRYQIKLVLANVTT